MTTMIFDKLNDRLRSVGLDETLAGSTPLLAVVGAGDLALERLRDVRDELASRAASFDPKVLREHAQASLTEGMEALQSEVLAAPEQLRSLPEKAQEWPTRAQSLFADLVSTAFSTYGELAGRGKTIVSQAYAAAGADADAVVDESAEAALDSDVLPVSRPVPPVVKPGVRRSSAGTKPASPVGTAPAKKTATRPSKVSATSPLKRAAKSASSTTASESAAASEPSLAPKTRLAAETPVEPDPATSIAAKTTADKAIATKSRASKSIPKKS